MSAPLLVIAKDEGQLIGAAGLNLREMDIYPEKEFWLGGVYVIKTKRGKGVASVMISEVLSYARLVGITELYLQTEQLDGGLYRKHGFKPLEEVVYQEHKVLVMVANIGI